MPKDGVECKSFIAISTDSLLIYYNRYYLQVYLENCAYKIVDSRIIDYLDENHRDLIIEIFIQNCLIIYIHFVTGMERLTR